MSAKLLSEPDQQFIKVLDQIVGEVVQIVCLDSTQMRSTVWAGFLFISNDREEV